MLVGLKIVWRIDVSCKQLLRHDLVNRAEKHSCHGQVPKGKELLPTHRSEAL